jgi:putative ABC transport system substrate-binding protein
MVTPGQQQSRIAEHRLAAILAVGIKRREFIALLCGAVASPKRVLAEANRRRPVIAWLSALGGITAKYVRPFLEGMRELGYKEGRDFDMAYRFADGHYDRLPSLARELADLDPDIFIAPATLQAVGR